MICLWLIFPSWGRRLFGRQGWAEMMVTAAVVDVLLLALAVWWIKRFDTARAEWA